MNPATHQAQLLERDEALRRLREDTSLQAVLARSGTDDAPGNGTTAQRSERATVAVFRCNTQSGKTALAVNLMAALLAQTGTSTPPPPLLLVGNPGSLVGPALEPSAATAEQRDARA